MEYLYAGELVGKAIGAVAVTSSIGYFTTKSLDHLLSAPDKAKAQELLTRKLPTLQAILEGIDQNVVLDNDRHALDELLWQLRTSMEKVDDALDELEFYNLKKACRETLTASSHFIKLRLGAQISRKVSSCLKRLKSSMEELDLVSDGVANFLSHMSCMNRSKDSIYDQKLLRETGRWLTIGKVFGRDTEKEQLVQWLTTGLFAHQDVLAIAITGVAGVGKTTLAQYTCHDERVLMHFDSIIWIHVSRHFDPLTLTKRILESLTEQVPATESIDVLQGMLKRLLVSKRFLLILDDSWEDMIDLHKWQQFLIPLYEPSVGSKILITTRMKSVVLSIEYELKRHGKYCMELNLDGLGSKPMLEVFRSCAFPMVSVDDAQGFHLMSEEIVKRLNGCPLIATSLGEYLWSKMDRSEWSSVLDPQFQYIAIPSVLEVLYLSYLNLPQEVQNCFRYCSLFPPKHKFNIEELVDMWICSGIISQRPGNLGVKDIFNMEAIARDYFDYLVRKSLLTVATPLENHYIMPDLVYELARYISSKEVLWISAANGNICVPNTVCHLSIEEINCEVIKNLSQYMDLHLRTLVIRSDNGEGFSKPEVAGNLNKLIKRSKSLRVLCLHGNNCFALKIAFSKLKHLRYIFASSIGAFSLSEILELHHMEVIKIQIVNCKEKINFHGLGNLLKLRKLDLPRDTLSQISHIGQSTTLQELSRFCIRGEQGHKMEELRDLARLQKICLEDMQNIHSHDEACSAELNNKPNMKSLCLQWASTEHQFHDYEVLDGLAPHNNLNQLIIRGYSGAIHPRWMDNSFLPNLSHLELDGCVEWMYLPNVSTLRTLRHLYLSRLFKLGETNSQPDWIPPCLVTLIVKNCPALLKLPDLPLTLQLLDISDSGINFLPSRSINQPSDSPAQLSQLCFELCENLDPESCLKQLSDYKELTELSIVSCSSVSYLPAESIFRSLSKLKKVQINECEKLSSLGGLGALGCLRELNIKSCPNLVTSTLPSQSLMWHSLLLETLEIDDCNLLIVKPLNDLRNTEHLIISDGSRMDTLPLNWLEKNLSVLESIEVRNATALSTLVSGSGMEKYSSLRRICLTNASALKLLPNLPPNLWAFKVNGCHADFKSKIPKRWLWI